MACDRGGKLLGYIELGLGFSLDHIELSLGPSVFHAKKNERQHQKKQYRYQR